MSKPKRSIAETVTTMAVLSSLSLMCSLANGAGTTANADDLKTPESGASFSANEAKEKSSSGPVINSAKGSSAHVAGTDESGKAWTDLPRPDESWAALLEQKDRKPVWKLTPEEQDKILHSRAHTGTMMGSFYEFNNLLFCMGEPFLMTTSVEVSKIPLHTVHGSDYKPTEAEFFESMARQTQTSVRYDPTFVSKWIAAPPAMPLPYSVKLADDWKFEDRGMYVAYIPKVQPVGMDVYMLGRYSGLSPDKTRAVRNANALTFAKHFDESVTAESMKEVKVDDCDAIYWETKPPKRANSRWRQWSFIKNGEAFVIVSSIGDENASLLVPQVEAMVASFHVLEQPTISPGLQEICE